MSRTDVAFHRKEMQPYQALICKMDQDSIMSEAKNATISLIEKGRNSELKRHSDTSFANQQTKFSTKLSEGKSQSISKHQAKISIDEPYSELRMVQDTKGGSKIFKVKNQTQDSNS